MTAYQKINLFYKNRIFTGEERFARGTFAAEEAVPAVISTIEFHEIAPQRISHFTVYAELV
jgi:hypothetical protein